jgi:16S rRNA (cytosine967-C5)-methyltransferase
LDFLDYSDDKVYDAVLLDAPCTASGLMQRKPEILLKNKTEELESLIKKQRKLLEKSNRHLKSGGYLVYCVCSIFSKEGKEQIESFLKKNKNFSLVAPADDIQKYGKLLNNKMLLITPKQNYFTESLVGTIDGFFIAILKKEYE